MSITLLDDGYKTIKAKYEDNDVWKLTVNSLESKYSFWMSEERVKEFATNLQGLIK